MGFRICGGQSDTATDSPPPVFRLLVSSILCCSYSVKKTFKIHVDAIFYSTKLHWLLKEVTEFDLSYI